MPKKNQIIGDPNNPRGLAAQMYHYLDWLKNKGCSEWTLESGEQQLGYFSRWCLERSIQEAQEVTRQQLERYRGHVNRSTRIKDGQPLSRSACSMRLAFVRSFFRWLSKTRQIQINPAADLELPRLPFQLPRQVLSIQEIEQVFSRMNMSFKMAVRDRAIMELFYATGIRRSELCQLKMAHINLEQGVLLVECGKGNRDRMVPIGERALFWLERYLSEIRPFIAGTGQAEWLFLTGNGKPIYPRDLTKKLQKHIRQSGIEKSGSCHIFRHTMATLMLEGGADIRYVQEMLGHVKLNTTQIYTKVAINKLKEVHEKTHPGAFLRRPSLKSGTGHETPAENQ